MASVALWQGETYLPTWNKELRRTDESKEEDIAGTQTGFFTE